MTFSKTRAWIAGAVVIALLLAVAVWFLLISPKRAEAADTRELTVSQQSQNENLREEIEQLKIDFAKLPQYEAELAAMRRALPKDDQLNLLVRDMEGQSKAHNVQLFSVTPAAAVIFTGLVPGTDAGVVTPAAQPADPAAEPSAAPAPDAAAATPVAGGVLVQVPVNVTVNGNYQNTLGFLRALQQDVSRDYLITGFELNYASDQPGFVTANGDVEVTLTGYVFAFTDENSTSAVSGTDTQATAPAQGTDAPAPAQGTDASAPASSGDAGAPAPQTQPTDQSTTSTAAAS